MIHRALRVGVVGLMAIVSPLSCGGELPGASGGGAGQNGGASDGGAGQADGAAGSTGSADAAGIAEGSVIEWSIPFADSEPFQIAAWGTSVFYVTVSAEQMLGRLDTENDTVT